MNYKICEIMSKVILSDKKVKIKLLGDSITHGVGGTGFSQSGEHIIENFYRNPDGYCWAKRFKELMEDRYNCKVINNGCTGTRVQFIIENFDALVDDDDDIIICTIGTNNRHKALDVPIPSDLCAERNEFHKELRDRIIDLYKMFEKKGKKVIFVANIPASAMNEKDGDNYRRILHMYDVHDAYISAQAECGFPLVDLYTLFLQYCSARNINYENLLVDGLHPNDEGYDVMFELLIAELGIAPIAYN